MTNRSLEVNSAFLNDKTKRYIGELSGEVKQGV